MAPPEQTQAPPAGPGMRPDLQEKAERSYGRVEVDERFADLDNPLEEVPDDAEADLGEVLRQSRVEEVLDRLDTELVALHDVKRRVKEIAALLLVDKVRRTMGLDADPPTLHMSFTGNPGTGKTTVAQRMGEVLYQLGYIRKGHLVSVTRDDLVGQYVGHTAPKTREVLKRAMGGVLFIDEAYHLYRVDNERDYGQETVEMLLQVMENQRADLVVIMAGYADRMDRFFSDVPGLSSRIGHHIDFPDYNLDELMAIGHLMLREQKYRFSSEAEKAFEDYLRRRMEQPRFANGRSVRNALDRLRMRHANRLWEVAEGGKERLTKGDLVTIQPEDVTKSRVFGNGDRYDPEESH
jgi:probable Rubsico expression protein CbbX